MVWSCPLYIVTKGDLPSVYGTGIHTYRVGNERNVYHDQGKALNMSKKANIYRVFLGGG